MIYAVKHNKVDRTLYKANEDSLTASIFERLRYLPKELFHYILQHALFDEIPELDITKMESIEYWPNWESENTSNKKRVEPDIFIRTLTHDLIIEAKRYDTNQQNPKQWEREIQAYYDEYKYDSKPLLFIALGGINDEKTEVKFVNHILHRIYKCKWSSMLKVIQEVNYELSNSKTILSTNETVGYILEDIIMCFGMYGFATADWFERFIPAPKIQVSSLQFFNQSNPFSK